VPASPHRERVTAEAPRAERDPGIRSRSRHVRGAVNQPDAKRGEHLRTREVILDEANTPPGGALSSFEIHVFLIDSRGLRSYSKNPRGTVDGLPEEITMAKNPKLINPKIIIPKLINPKVINPKLINPKIIIPKLINPKIINPKIVPKLIDPKIVVPKLINPKIINPKIINPKIIQPKVINPKIFPKVGPGPLRARRSKKR
jgi:hypothetical protein